MQAVLGVIRRYFPETSTTFVELKRRFQRKFGADYPEEGPQLWPRTKIAFQMQGGDIIAICRVWL